MLLTRLLFVPPANPPFPLLFPSTSSPVRHTCERVYYQASSASGRRVYGTTCKRVRSRYVVSCVYVDTEGEREFMESVRVCLGIQLERAIGPNGMKFLCGQTQERSRFLFSRPTSTKPRPYLALNLLQPKLACRPPARPFARSLARSAPLDVQNICPS